MTFVVGHRFSDATLLKLSESHKGKRSDGQPVFGFYIDKRGYRCVTGIDHPLVTSRYVLEHRMALYDEIGPGPHPLSLVREVLELGRQTRNPT